MTGVDGSMPTKLGGVVIANGGCSTGASSKAPSVLFLLAPAREAGDGEGGREDEREGARIGVVRPLMSGTSAVMAPGAPCPTGCSAAGEETPPLVGEPAGGASAGADAAGGGAGPKGGFPRSVLILNTLERGLVYKGRKKVAKLRYHQGRETELEWEDSQNATGVRAGSRTRGL